MTTTTIIILLFVAVIAIYIIYTNSYARRLRRIGVMAGMHYIQTGDLGALLAYKTVFATASDYDSERIERELHNEIKSRPSVEEELARRFALSVQVHDNSKGLAASIKLKIELRKVSNVWFQAITKNSLKSAQIACTEIIAKDK